MKAFEAMELTKGSIKRKGLIFKIKLAWLCGILNHKIENNAELGFSEAELEKIDKHNAKLYYPLMAKCYENDGYFVCYQNHYDYYNAFKVIWNKEKIPNILYNYDYYTKEKE